MSLFGNGKLTEVLVYDSATIARVADACDHAINTLEWVTPRSTVRLRHDGCIVTVTIDELGAPIARTVSVTFDDAGEPERSFVARQVWDDVRDDMFITVHEYVAG